MHKQRSTTARLAAAGLQAMLSNTIARLRQVDGPTTTVTAGAEKNKTKTMDQDTLVPTAVLTLLERCRLLWSLRQRGSTGSAARAAVLCRKIKALNVLLNVLPDDKLFYGKHDDRFHGVKMSALLCAATAAAAATYVCGCSVGIS